MSEQAPLLFSFLYFSFLLFSFFLHSPVLPVACLLTKGLMSWDRLAHCKQLNHSKAFWAVRNQDAREMEGLWRDGYTGEGLWGRGRELETGRLRRTTILAGDALPEHICGGTYRTNRRGGRKRKAKSALS